MKTNDTLMTGLRLLDYLQRKYPALEFSYIDKAGTGECDNDNAPEELICFSMNSMVYTDPFASDCGRFEVNPKTTYGIDHHDAAEMKVYNNGESVAEAG